MAEMSRDELLAELDRLKQQNDELKKAKIRPLSCKVSQRGAVSVYGLGRFPVTLYRQQWERLLDFGPSVSSFMDANEDKLSVKE